MCPEPWEAEGLRWEALAASAASHVLPTPEVLGRVDFAAGSAMLTARVPGKHAWSPFAFDEATAWRRGAACGEAQLLLGTVASPDDLPAVYSPSPIDPVPGRLLHLDLHPLNILMSEADEVVAVLDWTNARSGDPTLDRARTATILFLEPQTKQFADDPSWRAFVAGWAQVARLNDLPSRAAEWACRFMLRDLANRYSAAELAHVHNALELGVIANL